MPVLKQILRTNRVILPERHPAVTANGGLTAPLHSQAVRTPRLLFIGGLVGTKGQSAELADPDIETQTEQLLENMNAVLNEAGLNLADVVRIMVLIRERGEFQRMNNVYVRYFPKDPPSRTCSTVADMYPGARVQMAAIASYEPKTSVQPKSVTAPELHPALINLPPSQRRPFYSQALRTPSFMFLSGIVGTDPDRSHITDTTFEGQARKAMANVQRILEAGGLGTDNIVNVLALLQDQGDAGHLREIYADSFARGRPPQCAVTEGEHFPASKVEIISIAADDPQAEVIVGDPEGKSLTRSLRSSFAGGRQAQLRAIKAHGLLFVNGLTGSEAGDGSIEDHTRRALDALTRILAAAGASMADVVNTTVFLRSSADVDGMNRVYAGYFPNDPPARASATMFDLQPGAKLEIMAIASSAE